MSKATDVPLHEFALNPGDPETYDGRKVARWLFEAVTGAPMSEQEAEALVDEARLRHEARGAH